jgi:deoxycytidylate deaminase
MKPLQTRSLAAVFVAALVVGFPVLARAAQEATSDRLTADQIKTLAASTSPADHQTLGRHFAALAAEYAADAVEHDALAKAYRGHLGPSETKRPGAVDTAAHCERLAEYSRKLAAEAREMASTHDRMRGTATATAPAATIPGNRSGDLLVAADVKALVGSAASPADHLKLSRHYAALAARFKADATTHEELSKALRAGPNPSETKRPGAPDTAAHCDRLASLARQAAEEARQLAAAHEQMAGTAK